MDNTVLSGPVTFALQQLSRELASPVIKINGQDLSSIEETITHASQLIKLSIDSLGSCSFTDNLAVGVIAAVVGALSAFVFNFLFWRRTEKKAWLDSFVGEVRSIISELESRAVSYWVTEFSGKNESEWSADEVKIKGDIRLIRKQLRNLEERRGISDTMVSALRDFVDRIYDEITGDGFESKTRKVSKKKAASISLECTDMRARLAGLTN